MRRSVAGLTAGLVLAAASLARADETTFCNAYITALPYTISVQGHYCFNRNLSTAITTGAAITINTDFVVLDLNNFKLGGGSAGLGTEARGVYAMNRRNITIRNGNIRGFHTGIEMVEDGVGPDTGNHTIENNVLDGNVAQGLLVIGSSNVLRNNAILNTGGSTGATFARAVVAYELGGHSLQMAEGNVIDNVFETYVGGYVIGLDVSLWGVAQGNTVGFDDLSDDDNLGLLAGIGRDNNLVYANYFYCRTCSGNLSLP